MKRMAGSQEPGDFKEPSLFGRSFEDSRQAATQRVAPRRFILQGEDYVRNTLGIDLSILDAPSIALSEVQKQLAEVKSLEDKVPAAQAIAAAYQRKAEMLTEIAQLQEATGKAAMSASFAHEKALDGLDAEAAKMLGQVAIHRAKHAGDAAYSGADLGHKYGQTIASFRDRVTAAISGRQQVQVQTEERALASERLTRMKAIAAFAAGKGDTQSAIEAAQYLQESTQNPQKGALINFLS